MSASFKYILFKVLEICDYDKADDDHEEPGSDLVPRDDGPLVDLVGVLPRSEVCRDVLRDPAKTLARACFNPNTINSFMVDVFL